MLRALATATLLMLPTKISMAQQLPRFDIEATCREAQPLGPEDRDPYQGCLKDEGKPEPSFNASGHSSTQ